MGKRSSDYWEKRIAENEENAQKYAGKEHSRQLRQYKNEFKKMTKQIDKLYEQIDHSCSEW